jgi:hypothetical protein
MNTDPRKIIVVEGLCDACGVRAIHVYHQDFPEMRIEGMSAEQAADQLAVRLTAALDNVSDPSHRDAVQVALGDARAFLNREGAVHPGRDVSSPGTS